MAGWAWALLAGVVASTAALVGSGLILILRERARGASRWLLAFAIGTLLGAATLQLLPEAIEHVGPAQAMPLFLAGMLGFTALERMLRWRHPHEVHSENHPPHAHLTRATALMLLWGDSLHNLVDGLVLGAAFAVDPGLGSAVTLAVFVHEVPQELGDFAVLLESGISRRRALVLNYLSALAVLPGAAIAYAVASESHQLIGWLLPIAAGAFVYIALADLVPALHHRRGGAWALMQLALIGAGVAVIAAVSLVRH